MNQIRIIVMLLFCSMANKAVAREGYHIRLKVPGVKDSMVYLVHYPISTKEILPGLMPMGLPGSGAMIPAW